MYIIEYQYTMTKIIFNFVAFANLVDQFWNVYKMIFSNSFYSDKS